MKQLSVVIPAYNEAENIEQVIATIPIDALTDCGWRTEIVVVDNASSDGTGPLALDLGARVVFQPARGYGNAYKAGFAAARGDVIATGDADCTYPFDALPKLLATLVEDDIDFMSTNRLGVANRASMKPSHKFGNFVLTSVSRTLFRSPFRDSQSGMWIFKRHVWNHLDVRAAGMAFSQEIKHEAHLKGFRCAEVPIEYRPRGGQVKLNAGRDGVINTSQLFSHRVRGRRVVTGIGHGGTAPTTRPTAVATDNDMTWFGETHAVPNGAGA